MSEAEKQAIRKAFAEDLEGTDFEAKAPFTGSQDEILSKGGGDTVHQALVGRGWTVTREEPAKAVKRPEIVNELTGWIVGCQGSLLGVFGHEYTEAIARSGAESIVDAIESKGWHVGEE